MTRAFGYVRLSKYDEHTTSPQRQRKAIEKLCADRGWSLVETFTDIDVSAYANNGEGRAGFDRMMSRLDDTDAIVFLTLDRLTRSTVQAGQVAEACKNANVALVATDMDIDTTSPGGEFIFTIMAAKGRMESQTTSVRSRAMMAYKAERGEWVGRVPYGWKVVDKRLEPDRRQQAVLLKAAKRYIAGETFSEIARDLGLNVAPLIRMLHSERVQDALPDDVSGPLAASLVDRRLQRVPSSSQSLMGGIARCGVCGGGMVAGSTRAGREGIWRQYRCPVAGHVGISGPWLDAHVSSQVVDAIDTGKLLDALRRKRKVGRSRKASEIEARIELLDQMFTDGKIPKARYERSNDLLVEQLATAHEAERTSGVDLPADLARNLAERWDGLSIQTRRRIIRAVLERVEIGKAVGHGPVDESRVRLVWRG